MAFSTAYTLSEALEMMELWKQCEKALASGQAASYKIGTREFTSFDINEVHGMVIYFNNIVESIRAAKKTVGVRRGLPRDL